MVTNPTFCKKNWTASLPLWNQENIGFEEQSDDHEASLCQYISSLLWHLVLFVRFYFHVFVFHLVVISLTFSQFFFLIHNSVFNAEYFPLNFKFHHFVCLAFSLLVTWRSPFASLGIIIRSDKRNISLSSIFDVGANNRYCLGLFASRNLLYIKGQKSHTLQFHENRPFDPTAHRFTKAN